MFHIYSYHLITAQYNDIVENLLWFSGNILAQSHLFRDKFFHTKIYEELIKLFSKDQNPLEILRMTIWVASQTLKNIKTTPPKTKILELVTIFANYLYTTDFEVITNCLWGLNYASQFEDSLGGINSAIINSGAVVKLMKINFNKNPSSLIPSVRLIGNLCSGVYSDVDVKNITILIIILYY
jgi:hypothetical protein